MSWASFYLINYSCNGHIIPTSVCLSLIIYVTEFLLLGLLTHLFKQNKTKKKEQQIIHAKGLDTKWFLYVFKENKIKLWAT